MMYVMYPIAARYGSLFLYSYTIVLATGVLAAIGLTAWLSRRNRISKWFDGILVVLIAVLLGGRLGFVIFRWDYYLARPAEIDRLTQGGIAYHPALVAGLAAMLIWTLWHKKSFYRYAALLAPGIVLVTIFGWAACYLEGCAYGRETFLGPLTSDLPDEFGVFAVRYQTQVIGMLLSLMGFSLIMWYRRHGSAAAIFWLAIAAVSLAHIVTGLFRGDPSPMIGSLRLETLIDGALVLLALLWLQYEGREKQKQMQHFD